MTMANHQNVDMSLEKWLWIYVFVYIQNRWDGSITQQDNDKKYIKFYNLDKTQLLIHNPTHFVGIQSTMERETAREKCKNNPEGGGDTISIKILHQLCQNNILFGWYQTRGKKSHTIVN